jgi:hypothetical protein
MRDGQAAARQMQHVYAEAYAGAEDEPANSPMAKLRQSYTQSVHPRTKSLNED